MQRAFEVLDEFDGVSVRIFHDKAQIAVDSRLQCIGHSTPCCGQVVPQRVDIRGFESNVRKPVFGWVFRSGSELNILMIVHFEKSHDELARRARKISDGVCATLTENGS